MSLSYSQFADGLLDAFVKAADKNQRGQVTDVMAEATILLPDVSEQWVSSAVKRFEAEGSVFNVSRSISPPRTALMVTGLGRRRAEAIRAGHARGGDE
jgi:hypothetical protein